jgi:nucleotide-binding universal stress UspA family protein
MERRIYTYLNGDDLTHSTLDWALWLESVLHSPLTLINGVEEQAAYASVLFPLTNHDVNSQHDIIAELIALKSQQIKLQQAINQQLLTQAKAYCGLKQHQPCRTERIDCSLRQHLLAHKEQVKALVLSRQGTDMAPNTDLIGSSLETLCRQLHKPILVVNRAFSPPKNILFAYDDSEVSQRALFHLCEHPLGNGVRYDVVHVQTLDAPPLSLDRVSTKLTAAGVAHTLSYLTHDDVPEALLAHAQAQQADLLMLGAFSHSTWREFFLGSVTTELLAKAPLSLLLFH